MNPTAPIEVEAAPSRAERGVVALLRKTVDSLRRKTEFGDIMLFFFVAAFTRQYFWLVSDNYAAWTLTFLFSALVIVAHLLTKEDEQRTPPQFWLVVALPLLVFYAMRVPFPDGSFDVLNYRLLHSERALRGFLFLPGEFFPTPAPYNPTPDIITGMFRYALGYRLGTVVNYLALLWTGAIIEKLLRPHIEKLWLRCFGVLLALMSEQLLFEINNYMVDLLSLPLTLGALLIVLRARERDLYDTGGLVRLALYIGGLATLKLTNLFVAFPIAMLYAWYVFVHWRRATNRPPLPRFAFSLMRRALLAMFLFLIPLLPFSIYIYRQTGSAFFPLYNAYFRSPYWPISNAWDARWGPQIWWEKFIWPLLLPFRLTRLSEIPVYSGRITLGFIVALLCLALVPKEWRVRALVFVMLLGSFFWSATMGYVRYGFSQEVLGAVITLCFAQQLLKRNGWTMTARRAAAIALWGILAAQACLASYYTGYYEWSMRPQMFANFPAWRAEARYLLRDHSLRDFISESDRQLFEETGAWVESSIKCNGIEALLNNRIPIIGVRMNEYFVHPEGRQRFAEAVQRARGQRMFSLSTSEELPTARAWIRRRGLEVRSVVQLKLPFYSPTNQLNMFLIEVAPPEPTTTSAQ